MYRCAQSTYGWLLAGAWRRGCWRNLARRTWPHGMLVRSGPWGTGRQGCRCRSEVAMRDRPRVRGRRGSHVGTGASRLGYAPRGRDRAVRLHGPRGARRSRWAIRQTWVSTGRDIAIQRVEHDAERRLAPDARQCSEVPLNLVVRHWAEPSQAEAAFSRVESRLIVLEFGWLWCARGQPRRGASRVGRTGQHVPRTMLAESGAGGGTCAGTSSLASSWRARGRSSRREDQRG